MKANHPSTRTAALAMAGAALIALGSCTAKQPTPPAPVPSPRPSPAVRPLPPTVQHADWRDAPQTPGTWRWRTAGGASQAEFGVDPATPLFVVSCARPTRVVSLVRPGPAPEAGPMHVATTGPDRNLQARAIPGPPPALGAALNAQDPLLEAVAFSRGRFMIETPGQPALYLPSWPEISRAIEDCR
jgi:hypothetical protein